MLCLQRGRTIPLILAALYVLFGRSAIANGFLPESRTWAELVSKVDAVCLTKLIPLARAQRRSEQAVFQGVELEVIEVLKGSPSRIKKGDRIQQPRGVEGVGEGLFFMLGVKDPTGRGFDWDYPWETTPRQIEYLTGAPPFGSSRRKRLAHLRRFLDLLTDPIFCQDLGSELHEPCVGELAEFVRSLPREKIRHCFVDPKTPPAGMPFYGFLLGFCGEPRDAELLAGTVKENRHEFRNNIDQAMAGYLVLTGNAGLDNIDAWKLRNKSAPYSEVCSAMSALHYLWTTGNSQIKKERLLASMRPMVDRKGFAEQAIDELTGWHDWGSMDRLVARFDTCEDLGTKQAIIRQVLACTNAGPREVSPQQRAAAGRYLVQLRKMNSKMVRTVESWQAEGVHVPPFRDLP